MTNPVVPIAKALFVSASNVKGIISARQGTEDGGYYLGMLK